MQGNVDPEVVIELMGLLSAHGADFCYSDQDGRTPLHRILEELVDDLILLRDAQARVARSRLAKVKRALGRFFWGNANELRLFEENLEAKLARCRVFISQLPPAALMIVNRQGLTPLAYVHTISDSVIKEKISSLFAAS